MKYLIFTILVSMGANGITSAQAQTEATPTPAAEVTPTPSVSVDPVPGPMPAPVTAQCVTRDDQSTICLNDRVIDYRNETGTVSEIYNDLTGVVAFDDESNQIDLQYLSREVQCLFGFCIGDRVRDDDGFVGTITDLFENGIAEVLYPNGEVWYLELNEIQSAGDSVVVNNPWPAPRPYPDTRYYGNCVFPPRPGVIIYGWPRNYPYGMPPIGRRYLYPVHPVPPRYIGRHPFPNYPYQRGVQYPSRPAQQRPVTRGGMNRPFPGNNGGVIRGGNNFPGNNGGVIRGGNNGGMNPRPNFPGNNGNNGGVSRGGNNGGGNPFPGGNNGGVSRGGNNGGGNSGGVSRGGGSPGPSRPSSPPPSRPSGGGGGGGVSRGNSGGGGGGGVSRGGGGGGGGGVSRAGGGGGGVTRGGGRP